MAGISNSSPSPIAIGNCKVVIEGHGVSCEISEKSLLVSVSSDAKILISVDDPKVYSRRRTCKSTLLNLDHQDNGMLGFPSRDHSFLLLNPKDADSHSKSLLQEVLELYMEELPTMNYAANTGKKSQFLEKCTTSGKYTTLVLRSYPVNGCGEVIAAVSYQIIPNDTQYAEIPLTAVSSKNQKMGFGQALYKELRDRLQNVGILTIFCWADKTSEGFWLKQGFVTIGEVNSRGKVSRLPIRTDIRRALSFPGGSMFMVAHVKKDTNNIGCNSSKINLREAVKEFDVDVKDNSSQQRIKRPIWEASLSSLKSKRVRGAHLIGCCQNSNQSLACDNCFLQSSRHTDMANVLPDHSNSPSCFGIHDAGRRSGDLSDHLVSEENCPRIMFMDIADDVKKTWLTKIVEELGGSVTCDGSNSTHVITGKARRTLNFSIALCSGAWIVSPKWLKASFREGRFLEESQFILEDEDYLLKYKTDLRNVVNRAKTNPKSLLRGYHVCLPKHTQPSVGILSTIIRSAGGNVMHGLGCINEPSKTIFLACEEDMSEALLAAKKGAWTFSSDWLMNCVMKQELDLEAPQFAVSL
ncbi:BRCA1 C Terminus (BRCT) domain [Musa troglodytarum]|uniref:BRCA1 C Terminus (BRCT) domain n=1 Tax=Musa troglodytarum TaxID=320322 RepID=A0A9E7JUN3_9LILI|nr:BRCA1 C Terminus (BRCT) domain [Musa troglodytarum]URD93149.1 BRCA1 C Terminus (BRCT) domain [Musa troglodytarum]